MSASHVPSQDTESSRSGKRRKRKERAGTARTPEPKDIVSGAGQPLDVSVRRELEEQLGHDLGRVRLHTDRDAGALTDLLGADAVAVGQDIFFREGAYRPGTADGRRLLAHEVLHTVQNPHGLGALRAGRDLGAVSLPQQAVEREAESAAQDVAAGEAAPADREPQVQEGRSTPGWLRYTTVHADRNRMEQLDPATLVDRLANSVVRSLRGDPEDRSKRTRMQLGRMSDALQDAVLERLESRLLSTEHDRVLDLVDEVGFAEDLEQNSLDAPFVEADQAEELLLERETEQRSAEERRAEETRPAVAPGPEKEESGEEGATGGTPRNGGTAEHGTTPQGGGAPRGGEHGRKPDEEHGQRPGTTTPRSGGSSPSGSQPSPESPAAAEAQAKAPTSPSSERQQSASAQASGRSAGQQQAGDRKGAGAKEGKDLEGAGSAGKEQAAAEKRAGGADAPAAGRQPERRDERGAEKPDGPAATGKDTQLPGPTSRLDGVRAQDLGGPEERAAEDPFGSGSASEVDVGGEEKSAWDVKLQPEDFVPEKDLDVSAVPTADQLDPSSSGSASAPSFPAPPVTKADTVQAERDTEDAEDAAADAGPEDEAAERPAGTEPPVEAEEGGPGADRPGALELERAGVAGPGSPGATSRDPKSGDDPKAGPVTAQTTVQEAPGKPETGTSEGGSPAKEQAAKEEKGTAAAGDNASGTPEKASQQAVGGKSAPSEPGAMEQQRAGDLPSAAKLEPAADAKAASPTSQDTQAPGGSGPGTPGGPSSMPESDTQNAPSPGNTATNEASSRTEPPTAREAAPAPPPEPASAPARSGGRAPRSRGGGGGTRSAGGGGRGGGGSRTAASAAGKKKPAAPDLSQVTPEAGLSTASNLKPHQALEAMGGLNGAVDKNVGEEHQALKDAPPSMERPAGAPQTLRGAPRTSAPGEYSADPAAKVDAPEKEKAKVEGEPPPQGDLAIEGVEEPSKLQLGLAAGGQLIAGAVNGVTKFFGADEDVIDTGALMRWILDIPSDDEMLAKAQVGTAPGVELQGETQGRADEQSGELDTKGQELHASGRQDADRPLGEDQVYPDVPKETLTSHVPGSKGQGPAGGGNTSAAGGRIPPEALSEVAEHERRPQLKAAFSDGRKAMSDKRQTKDKESRESQEQHKRQVRHEIESNTRTQTAEREKTMSEVSGSRSQWKAEQDKELGSLGTKKSAKITKIRQEVQDKENDTDTRVRDQHELDQENIHKERKRANEKSESKKKTAHNDSGSWISRAFSFIREKLTELKDAIIGFLRAALTEIRKLITNFRTTVIGWIDAARKFIVDKFKDFTEALIQLGKDLLNAVLEIAKRIRDLIIRIRDAAIALVNRIATQLKQMISDLLDAIGALLSRILDALKKALRAVVEAVVNAVKAIMDFAAKLLGALGDWMLIAVDFLADPGGWLSGAKNSAVDGAKNHLFAEVSSAVKQWFKDKIQEIIGVPKAVLDKLLKGGFTLEQIVKEAWDAVVPQLPLIIGELVMTKIVAKLIPGAGWVMAVIDAIRTAWGALSEILRALGLVLDWLKAVRRGGAGLLFAKAVAAGVVALLELLYEALLSGIGKYVAKVGRRLKGVAAKLGDKDKGGKPGSGKGAGADGTDSRAGRRKDEPAPATAGAPGTHPVTGRPRPGTIPDVTKPGTRHGAGPDPGKDAPGPGRPKGGADDGKRPEPTSKDKNGRPKGKDDEKPDTRPTPSPKPKPKPEPRPKPKDDPEAKPKPKDQAPGKPKSDAKDTPGKPKPDGDKDPTRPKDGNPNKPEDGKGGDKDSPGKPKNKGSGRGADERPKKPKDTDGEPKKPKSKDEARGPKKPKNDRPKDNDPAKEKQDKKDRRKKEEDSKDSKDERLRKIVARLRPRIDSKLRKGVNAPLMRAMLAANRAWFRLTSLSPEGGAAQTVVARLNPELSASEKHKLARQLQLQQEMDQFARKQAAQEAAKKDDPTEQEPPKQAEPDSGNAPSGSAAKLHHQLNPDQPLLTQTGSVNTVLDQAKREKLWATLQHGKNGPSVDWRGGFRHDPGGFLNLSSGDVRYQDARLATKQLKDVKRFVAGVQAIQRGDLKAAMETGHDLQKMMEFAYLRTLIESRRDPTMKTFGLTEISWAGRANSEAAAKQRLDEILSRGMMTHNRNVKLAKDVAEIARKVAPNGQLNMDRMDDAAVQKLFKDPTPYIIGRVHENEVKWALRAGQRTPDEDETRTSKETARQRLDRLTLWTHRVTPSDVHVTFDGYEDHLERMRKIIDEILDADSEVLDRAPGLWTP
ncbi:DUF4157 domain-containing protein [Streptomyces sp. NPDC047108]|uniref:eCIS core domain-containing protein n=1 Tax=Streptomyces sp. NPDC047108 TaxID=3155025 RepID=UPI0034053EEE